MNTSRHLTEAERQELADGTLAAEHSADISEHLVYCEACATDVARIKQLMTRIREIPVAAAPGPDLWPEIRSRIERDKIVQLPAGDAGASRQPGGLGRRRWWIAAGLAAAAMVAIVVVPRVDRGGDGVITTGTGNPNMSFVADSIRVYEQEATFLMNELEMRRAMMNPRTRVSVDRDLMIIDKAIAELKEAIARDPKNAALRQLLASSYKQKIELLKRAGAAG